jgi:hypothetical protein
MSLSQVINVTISRTGAAVDRATFGTPLFVFEQDLDSSPIFPVGKRVTSYTNTSAMIDDGFTATHPAVLAANAFFSQNPAVGILYVGVYNSAGTGADASVGDAVAAIYDESKDWFVATYQSRVVSEQVAFANAVTGLDPENPKMVFLASANAENYAAGDGGADDLLSKFNSDLVVTFYHDAAIAGPYTGSEQNPFPECAFAGHNLPFVAGSATWAYLQLNGVLAAKLEDGSRLLSDSERANIFDKNGNTTELIAGIIVTREGKCSSGEWIDISRGVIALDEDLSKDLFQLLVNQQGGKIPYTNSGMNQIRNVIQDRLNVYVNSNFINPNFVVNVPDANKVPAADKQARVLNGVGFTAELQGAVHTMIVTGNVVYDLGE